MSRTERALAIVAAIITVLVFVTGIQSIQQWQAARFKAGSSTITEPLPSTSPSRPKVKPAAVIDCDLAAFKTKRQWQIDCERFEAAPVAELADFNNDGTVDLWLRWTCAAGASTANFGNELWVCTASGLKEVFQGRLAVPSHYEGSGIWVAEDYELAPGDAMASPTWAIERRYKVTGSILKQLSVKRTKSREQQLAQQRQAMDEIRAIANVLESYRVDKNQYPIAHPGAVGQIPDSLTLLQVANRFRFPSKDMPNAYRFQKLQFRDPWGTEYLIATSTESLIVASAGGDKRWSDSPIRDARANFDNDIIFMDGYFVHYPDEPTE